ncbi:leucine-rich repeat domain-containing protein [Microbacterium aurantiacum]|uniref:leucine-rich repeat domain-containing protein n=1 Tax=Microbacterium aurantiacum TaxID=162393 RepID=UPI000C7FD415|nr:leucine-rich repeat domain-containing protein [Microbacterium aurantiacum]
MSYQIVDGAGGRDLVLSGAWSAEAEEIVTGGVADGLVINYARGYSDRDIVIPGHLPIKRLNIILRSAKNMEPIYAIGHSLESLSVQVDPQVQIDLSRLPRLRHLATGWKQVSDSVHEAKNLRSISLLTYSAPDLTPLIALSSLTKISLKHFPSIRSLHGIEEFRHLESLGIFTGRYLDDISALARLQDQNLIDLSLSSCRRISALDAVGDCAGLRYLDMSDGGTIDSVAPLARLRSLVRLYLHGSTRIADGDLAPIAGFTNLHDFRMMNRSTYRPSVGEIQASLPS